MCCENNPLVKLYILITKTKNVITWMKNYSKRKGTNI